MNKDFLLNSPLARDLYKTVSKLPIVDYHNHLSKDDIINNRKFNNITELWITPDPYKHRLMRIMGVKEKYITGDASDYEKFSEWCRIFPFLMGTPVYDWSLLELMTVFETDMFPCAENCERLWNELNSELEIKDLRAVNILKRMNVEYAAPCASVCEDISFYKDSDVFAPSLRGDDITSPDKRFIEKLEDAGKVKINSLKDFYTALSARLDEFESVGCVFADHALDDGFRYVPREAESALCFEKILRGEELIGEEKDVLSSAILKFMACEYSKRGLVMQLHIGALRKTSTRLRKLAGSAGGYAGIGTGMDISQVTEFLDSTERAAGALPKTILYTLNPAYNASLAILSGSFSKDGVNSVVTQGPAWWWCDHIAGIKEVLENLSVYSVFSEFVGMTTDSRSFLSFVRHDYFRRVLCSFIAEKAERGEFPERTEDLRIIAEKMAYKNAAELLSTKKIGS